LSQNGDNPDDPKTQWQKEQLARDAELEKQRLKNEKAKARKARAVQRKLKKAKQELEKLGEITAWEEEFADSVDERIEKYGAAFADREKGGPSEALSNRQKQVLAQMRRKAKDKGKQSPGRKGLKPKSTFRNKTGFKPRVRHLEDDMVDDEPVTPKKEKPALKVIKGGRED